MALITTANTFDNFTAGNDVVTGTSKADAFIIDNTSSTGQDQINFGKNDSLLTKAKLFDSNEDGFITFGGDRRLDVFGRDGGSDEINMVGVNDEKGLRYLGTSDGYFVYGDALTKLQNAATKSATESTVANNDFDANGGNKTFFFDTALGLNLGADTIKGFGAGDRIITTSEIFDSNGDNVIQFGANGKLDLPGAEGGDRANGGTVTFDADIQLAIVDTVVMNGVTYYTYALDI